MQSNKQGHPYCDEETGKIWKLGEAPAEILYALVGKENGKAHLDLGGHGSQRGVTVGRVLSTYN